jgi:hypothetical protein
MRAWLIAVAMLLVSSSAWADDWVSYKSKAGGVALMFPGNPSESTQESNSTTMHMAAYASPAGDAKFALFWTDIDAKSMRPTTKQMFDELQGPFAQRAKIASSKDTNYRGMPARELDLIGLDNKEVVKLRLVIKNNKRAFIVAAMTAGSGDAKKFLDSLRID